MLYSEEKQLQAYPAPIFNDIQYPQRPFTISIAGKYIGLYKHNMTQRTIDEYVFALCIDGTGWVSLDNQEKQVVHTGDLLFLPADVPQCYGNAPDTYWSLLWFHCVGDGVRFFYERFRNQVNSDHIPFAPSCNAYFYFETIFNYFQSLTGFTDLLQAEAVACQFLCNLVSAPRSRSSSCSNENLVHNAMKWMETTSQYNITLDDCAALFGVSKYHFIRLFKRYAGTTPIEYFQQIKLKKACSLLTEGSLSIAEISEYLEYSNPYHFSKIFKQYFGVSPSTFKKIL